MPDQSSSGGTISALLTESRKFPPSADFVKNAVAGPGIHERAAADPLAFWVEQAKNVDWIRPYSTLLEWGCACGFKIFEQHGIV